jgi:hypothetical protein
VFETLAGAWRKDQCELREIRIGKDVAIADKTAMGVHGQAFLSSYNDNGKQEGTYVYDGVRWEVKH